jgi:hypothetical protein
MPWRWKGEMHLINMDSFGENFIESQKGFHLNLIAKAKPISQSVCP